MRCQNCPKPASIRVGPTDEQSIPLCVDCHLKFVQATAIKDDLYAGQMNMLMDMAEAISGVRGVMPRIPRRTLAVPGGNVTFNNIKIDNSSIGVINTGTIGQVDTAIGALKQSGDGDAAEALKGLTEAIVTNTELTTEAKNEVLDILSVLSSEATVPSDSRRSAAMRPLLDQIGSVLNLVTSAANAWAQYGPAIEQLFKQ